MIFVGYVCSLYGRYEHIFITVLQIHITLQIYCYLAYCYQESHIFQAYLGIMPVKWIYALIITTTWIFFLNLLKVLSYILLRNGCRTLQNYQSAFLIKIGKMSVWIFVSHYHIFMAMNGKAILMLIPKLYLINLLFVLVIFFVVFIIISDSLHQLKSFFSEYYVESI